MSGSVDPILSGEPFATFQGSGCLAGTWQCFVRFAGCAVRCPIRKVCDEQGALSFDGTERDAEQLADECLESVGRNGWVHITGGEPCDQPNALMAFAAECTKLGLRIHLQTSGLRRVPIAWDWLTISPKCRSFELVQTVGNELIIVNDPSWVIDCGILAGFKNRCKTQFFYLQPLYQPDGSSNIKETIELAERCNRVGQKWKLTDQFHKHWGIR